VRGDHAAGARAGQEGVGGRLAAQPLLLGEVTVDDVVEERRDTGRGEDVVRRSTSRFLRAPRPITVSASGPSSRLPSGSSMPRAARKERTPSARGLPST
jgi:hypothetical protein